MVRKRSGPGPKLDPKKEDANGEAKLETKPEVTEKSGDSKVAENGDKGHDNTKGDDKSCKIPTPMAKKSIKKSIPQWATVEAKPGKKIEIPAGSMDDIIVEAMKGLVEELGTLVVSSVHLKKEIKTMCPSWPKFLYKKAVAKAIEKDRLKQIKASFKLVAKPKPAKTPAKKGVKSATKRVGNTDLKLDDLIGNIFTWVCEPKEASILLIKKYIEKHHTKLDVGNGFKIAVENGIKKGQLDRINGQGMSGTLQLVDKAKKTGTAYEDAIEDAIIACNEPKDASIPALKHYLSEYHTEYNVVSRPKLLMNCLERCEVKGWVKRISGKGQSGTFRLTVPYRPNPRQLWGEWYEEEETPKKKRAKIEYDEYSEEEDEEEESEMSEDSEREVMPVKKNRASSGSARKVQPPKPKKKSLKSPSKKVLKTLSKKKSAPKSSAKKTKKRKR